MHLRLNRAAGGAPGGSYISRRGRTGQLAPEFVEIAALCGQDLASLVLGDRVGLGLARHLQDGARADAIDIALNERLRVGAQHGHQHLIQRHIRRAVGIGNASGSVSGLDGDGLFACRCGRTGRRRAAHGGRTLRGGFHGACRCNFGFGSHLHRRFAHGGGIKQHGVAARQSPGVPVGIHHQVHKRLVHGPIAAQAQHRGTVGALPHLNLDTRDHGRIFHALGAEGLRGGGGDTQRFCFGRGDLHKLDFRAQGFPQGGLNGDRAQRKCQGVRAVQTERCHCGRRQGRVFPTMHGCHQLIRFGSSVERTGIGHGHMPAALQRLRMCKSTLAAMFCTDKLT